MVFTERLAPKVAVPADFGIEHLGSPSHSNLTFNVKEGENILANSMIVSLNSPVVDDFTTNLLLTSVDVEDFERDAVQCFVEGCYTGRMEKMSRDNFREVNKMAHMFKVSWMQGRCADFFQYLLDEIPEDYQYENLLYFFEEAFYVQTTLQMFSFMNKVINKFCFITGCNNVFIPRYIMENQLDEKQLDVLVRMAGYESEILVKSVINQVTADKTAMSDNCRYLLQKVNLPRCFRWYPGLQNALIESLSSIENPAPEDYKLVLSLYKTSNDGKYDKFPNLFQPFETISTFACFEDTVNFLSCSPEVSSLYMFIEGIFCWLFDNEDITELPEDIIKNIACSVREARGWGTISTRFSEMLPLSKQRGVLFDSFSQQINELTEVTFGESHYYVASTIEYDWKSFFLKKNDVEFLFKETALMMAPCSRQGDCGFIVHVTPCSKSDNSVFNIQLLDDPAAYPSHIHFHEGLSFSEGENMHFVLQINPPSGRQCLFPVSWCGKPEPNRDGTILRWGANIFLDKQETIYGFNDEAINKCCRIVRHAKIRPAIFIKIDGNNF